MPREPAFTSRLSRTGHDVGSIEEIVGFSATRDSSEMSLVEDDHVVQTLAADRPYDAFDVGILPRRARGGADGREAERFDGAAERCLKVASRSWRRNLAVASSRKASRSCCRVHTDVGCCVALTCRIRRRS